MKLSEITKPIIIVAKCNEPILEEVKQVLKKHGIEPHWAYGKSDYYSLIVYPKKIDINEPNDTMSVAHWHSAHDRYHNISPEDFINCNKT